MPGFNPLGPPPNPFSGVPQNPALYAPAPNTDQSQATASILSRLAQMVSGGYNPYSPAPVAPIAPSGGPQGMASGIVPRGPQGQATDFSAPSGPVPGPMASSAPPPGMESGVALPPPMLRPGSDQGGPPTDPSSILSASVDAAQQAQNSPDVTGSVIKDLMSMGGDPEQNKWLALAKAGFAMAASKNPQLLGAAGEGAQAGLSDYLQGRQQMLQNRYTAAQLQQAEQTKAAEIQYRQQSLAQEQAKLDQAKSEFDQMAGIRKAQELWYSGRGLLAENKATGAIPAGAGGGRGGNPADTALMHYNAALANQMKLYLSALPVTEQMAPGNIVKAQQWAVQTLGPPPGGARGTPAPATGAPAAGAMPPGAAGPAPAGAVEGQTSNGGAYVNRGGWMFPVGQ